MVSKKAGKVTLNSKIELTADGKSRTTTQTKANAQGRAVNNLIVYENNRCGCRDQRLCRRR